MSNRSDGHVSDQESTRADEAEFDRDELEMQLQVIAEENRQLRERFAASRRSDHRRAGGGLVLGGLLALVAGWAFTGPNDVLFALGGTGIFAGLLTIYLTPERFVSADVGSDVYRTLARNHDRLVDELGLSDRRVYVPAGGDSGTRLYIPQRRSDTVPDPESFDGLFVIEEDSQRRGIAVVPTGSSLYDEFDAARRGPEPGSIQELVQQLGDATVEVFELADGVGTEVDVDGNRVSIELLGNVYGPEREFDQPLVSLFAVGLARHLGRPVDVEHGGEGRNVVTFRWESDETPVGSNDEPVAGQRDRQNVGQQ